MPSEIHLRDKAFKAAASARAKSMNQLPLLVVIAGELLGLFLLALGLWRLGAVVVGVSLCVGAVERVVLPPRVAGLLQVRSRGFDIVTLAGAGIAIIVLALWVPALT